MSRKKRGKKVEPTVVPEVGLVEIVGFEGSKLRMKLTPKGRAVAAARLADKGVDINDEAAVLRFFGEK